MNSDIEIEYFQNKPRSEWTIDDWKSWCIFCEKLAEESQSEFLKILKENLQLKRQVDKYEDYISKKYGLSKRVKTRGLITAPRGRPINSNKLVRDFAILMREKKHTWVQIGQLLALANAEAGTKYPTSERHLRSICTKTG